MNEKMLNTESFFEKLNLLIKNGDWESFLGKDTERKNILLKRKNSETLFCPLSAVYFFLTGREIHRGSFIFKELTDEFSFPWWEILEIAYAETACNVSRFYDQKLRNRLLGTLNLPLEQIKF
ncbi:MAG: hypothetical protein WCT19_02485 [Candidatus Paceibacterota bacterium]|jgi:hypothetical protein